MTGRSVRLGLAAVIGLLATTAVPAYADSMVTCGYQFNDWAGGFSASLYLTNSGPAIDGWTVRLTFPTATSLVNAWQAVMSQDSPYDATATSLPWDAVIPTDRVVSFGWTATAAATGPPTSVMVNGVAC